MSGKGIKYNQLKKGFVNLDQIIDYDPPKYIPNWDGSFKSHKYGKSFYIRPNKENWHKAMRASSTLPFLTRGYCMFDGVKLMDGGWSDPIPVRRAVELGATKIAVIRTMPADLKLEWSYFGWFGGLWYRENPRLSRRFSDDHQYYNDSIDYIANNPDHVEITQIAPPKFLSTSSYSTTKHRIDADYRLGLDLGTQFLHNFNQDSE